MKFCSACGTAYDKLDWPRVCTACGHEVWQNAVSVGVLVQPVVDGTTIGLLLTERGVAPQVGKLALLSGFQEIEDWRNCLAREAAEEIGLFIAPSTITLETCLTTPDGRTNLIFGRAPPLDQSLIGKLRMSVEVPRVVVLWPRLLSVPEFHDRIIADLAYPLHRDVIETFFKR